MKLIKEIYCCILLIFCSIGLVGCGSEADQKLDEYLHEVKNRPAKPIEPIPVFFPLAKFTYPEADTRRSPFKQKQVAKAPDQEAPNMNRPKQPLEFFSLDALKFVGTFKEGSKIWALIAIPTGEISRISIGDYMGKDYGRVIAINDASLKLEETVKISGNWEKRMTTLNLNAGTQE